MILSEEKVNQLNSAVLAYVGDAEFSLYIRTILVSDHDCKAGELTKMSNTFVKATAQSKMLDFIAPSLTDRERDIARRARNCHTGCKAKNAGLADYRKATALEAVFGYLFLIGETERLNNLEYLCFNYTNSASAKS